MPLYITDQHNPKHGCHAYFLCDCDITTKECRAWAHQMRKQESRRDTAPWHQEVPSRSWYLGRGDDSGDNKTTKTVAQLLVTAYLSWPHTVQCQQSPISILSPAHSAKSATLPVSPALAEWRRQDLQVWAFEGNKADSKHCVRVGGYGWKHALSRHESDCGAVLTPRQVGACESHQQDRTEQNIDLASRNVETLSWPANLEALLSKTI